MPKTNLPKIAEIRKQFPQFTFARHTVFHWSPKDNCVYYEPSKLQNTEGFFQLLHEIGHALCQHTTYGGSIQLLKIEAEAWQKAQELAVSYGIKIHSEHIERCLDSYRDWLHLRSLCPNCKNISLETEVNHYHCFHCAQRWKVPADQQKRNYRLRLANNL